MLRRLAELEPALVIIDTWNAESNDHMIAVNERLGCFVVARGQWRSTTSPEPTPARARPVSGVHKFVHRAVDVEEVSVGSRAGTGRRRPWSTSRCCWSPCGTVAGGACGTGRSAAEPPPTRRPQAVAQRSATRDADCPSPRRRAGSRPPRTRAEASAAPWPGTTPSTR